MTMRPPRTQSLKLYATLAAVATAQSLAAMAQDSNAPIDPKGILSALSVIKTKQSDAEKAQKNKVFHEIQAASSDNSSAVAFLEEAVRATRFQGESREQTQFRDWKKKQADEMKKPAFQTAVRLHLAYLVLTLERANGWTSKQILPSLLSYIAQAQSASDSLGDPMMQHEIGGSIFVTWYQIGSWVQQADDWESKPGNIDGMWQKVILPEMRAQKDPRILDYWGNKLDAESSAATRSGRTFDVERFNTIRRPSLMWQRAQDLLAIGQKNAAVNVMFALIKENPAHPEEASWVAALEGILKPPAPEPASVVPAPTAAAQLPATSPAPAVVPDITPAPSPVSSPSTLKKPWWKE